MRILSSVLVAAFALTIGFSAQSSELDNEASITNHQIQLSKDLPATVVVRVNAATDEIEVLHSEDELAADPSSLETLRDAEFVKIDKNAKIAGELDRDSSSSSWYFWFNYSNWYYPTYSYYGYNYGYTPYYSYNWGGYNYYYCRWNYRYGWYW